MARRIDIDIDGTVVRRPLGHWSPTTRRFLDVLTAGGSTFTPRHLGFEAASGGAPGCELVELLPGTVGNYPLSEAVRSEQALVTSAQLLRRLHDAAEAFTSTDADRWLLPPRAPAQTICHGDFAPYNVVFGGETAVAVIDFDTIHPRPRVWDVAYAVYRFAPLHAPSPDDGFGDERERLARARQFCDAYGLEQGDRAALVDQLDERLCALVAFMRAQAALGDAKFQGDLARGDDLLYEHDVTWLRVNHDPICDALTG